MDTPTGERRSISAGTSGRRGAAPAPAAATATRMPRAAARPRTTTSSTQITGSLRTGRTVAPRPTREATTTAIARTGAATDRRRPGRTTARTPPTGTSTIVPV